jgi:hypothetical protein
MNTLFMLSVVNYYMRFNFMADFDTVGPEFVSMVVVGLIANIVNK